jgi:hypothetical protein
MRAAARGTPVLCPWHAEKTPSCLMNIDANEVVCFGCGAAGTVAEAVVQAARALAERGYDDERIHGLISICVDKRMAELRRVLDVARACADAMDAEVTRLRREAASSTIQ